MKRILLRKEKVAMLFLIFLLSGWVKGWAQFTYDIVQDKPANGQLKRMVFIKWNDWKPNPGTFLGIPLNPRGYAFWQIVNKAYYKGEDRRPYRLPDGPFIKNYGDLTLQQMADKKIMDTTEKIRNTNLATYLSMTGGNGDIAYNLFFKRKFNEIFDEVNEWLKGMQAESPKALEACMNSEYFKNFVEYVEITKDRIKAIHESFVDKGVRMEGYLEIYQELSQKYNVLSHYLAGQVRLSKFPTQARLKEIKEIPVTTSDKEIVNKILSNFKF